jgi:hypothetical protein
MEYRAYMMVYGDAQAGINKQTNKQTNEDLPNLEVRSKYNIHPSRVAKSSY